MMLNADPPDGRRRLGRPFMQSN